MDPLTDAVGRMWTDVEDWDWTDLWPIVAETADGLVVVGVTDAEDTTGLVGVDILDGTIANVGTEADYYDAYADPADLAAGE